MRQEDRDFLLQMEKRIDERHETLVGYFTEEFERISKYHSAVNDRITTVECKVQKNTDWRKKITTVVSVVVTIIGGVFLWTLRLWDKIQDLLNNISR